ncbi:MAG: PIN domain-containing protein [Usitatibacter sp.]
MRIFLDANILFSASKSDGAIRQLLELIVAAGHECWADGFVIEEARRNLLAKAPDRIAALAVLLARISVAPTQGRDAGLTEPLPLPERDRPVLAAAIRIGCTALVTGDKTHFGRLYGTTLHGVTLHSPRSLAEALDIADPGRNSAQENRAAYGSRRTRRK